MNGYEFVEKIIGLTNYDIGPLINDTGGFETEWLEFKAATSPKDGKFNNNDNKWDYRWHVSQALFAMANSIGGAVLIGVGEGNRHIAEPTGLEHSGFSGDKDDFVRKFTEQILSPEAGWKTGSKGTWKCAESHNLFRPIWGVFDNQPILIVLVKPRKKEDKWLQLEHISTNSSDSVVLSRSQGDIGQQITIPNNELNNWWKNREIDRSDLNGRFQAFLSEWKISGKHSDSLIEEKVCSYIQTLQNQYNKNSADTIFIPLDAVALDNIGQFRPTAQPQDVLELLEHHPRLVLLGDPGSGKSTCLHHKAFSVAKGWKHGQPWTLIISLYEYTEAGLRSLILKQLPSLYWIDIEAQINNGEITLMFDALNECPTVRYEECYQEIYGLLQDYPSARIVISSRLTHNPYFHLATFSIRPMNLGQQRQLLGTYIENSNKSAEILEKLYRHPGTKHIASSPVLLKMVADVVINGGDLPDGLAKLYHCSLKVWHQRESDNNIKNGTPPLWSFKRVLEALAILSFRVRAEGKISCSVSFARQTLVQVMGDDVSRFLDRVAQGLLLKVDEKEEFLHFSHETIQEYLAAEYLVTNPGALGDLLRDESGKKLISWSMPVVFAFELIDNPSKEFLQSAWKAEPMLVAAAIRDSKRLALLPIHEHGDLWLRGALRVMRDEDPTPETLELSYVSHLPPKYPLPDILIGALRGTPFWYSAQSHPQGLVRLARLHGLIFDRSTIWTALVPYISNVLLAKPKNISPAQRVLIGETSGKEISTSLESATVAELCALLRLKKISKTVFLSNWESALQRSDDNQILMDLIALLRTNKELQKDNIKFSQFSISHKVHLNKIGKNWKLSLRLLNILVREGILSVNEVRDEPGRLEDIISRTSPMNAFRSLKNGIIKQEDIPKERLNELLGKMKPEHLTELKDKGLISKQDTLASRRDKKYSVKDLIDEECRKQIDTETSFQRCEVTVSKTFPEKNYGFVKHPKLIDDAIFWLNDIDNPDNKTIDVGDTLRVNLATKYNKKKEEWGVAVISGSILRKLSKLKSN